MKWNSISTTGWPSMLWHPRDKSGKLSSRWYKFVSPLQRGEQDPSVTSRRKTLTRGILNKDSVYRLGFLPPILGKKAKIAWCT